MSTKTEKDAIYSTLFFQIGHYCIRPWPWIIVALCAVVLYPDLSASDSKLGYVLAMKEFLPTGLKGLLLVAFFAAYMSTISTQLNWGTSYLINDFYKRFINPQAGAKQFVTASRVGTFALMLIALFATSFMTTISGVWSFIVECGAGLGVVLILRWYWWRINAWSEIVANIAPFVGYALAKYVFAHYDPSWGLGIGENPKGFFFTVGFTTAAWLIATYISPATDKEKLRLFFDKIQPDGNWRPFRKTSNGRRLLVLGVCWLSAIVMAYSFLFLTGSLIFKEWNDVLIYGILATVSFMILKLSSGKVKIFGD